MARLDQLRFRRNVLRWIASGTVEWHEVYVHDGYPFYVALLPDGSRAFHYNGVTIVRPFGYSGPELKHLRDYMLDLFFLAGKHSGFYNAPVILINGKDDSASLSSPLTPACVRARE